jgi:hypothetical protein
VEVIKWTTVHVLSSNQGFSRENLNIDGLCVLRVSYVDLCHFLIVIFLIYPSIINFIFIRLSRSHDLGCESCQSARLTRVFLVIFLIDYRFF